VRNTARRMGSLDGVSRRLSRSGPAGAKRTTLEHSNAAGSRRLYFRSLPLDYFQPWQKRWSSCAIFLHAVKNRLADPSEIFALEFKGEFRQIGICSVSTIIGIDWSIFEVCKKNDITGVAQKRPAAMTKSVPGRGVAGCAHCTPARLHGVAISSWTEATFKT
jgi:hypothetical protein